MPRKPSSKAASFARGFVTGKPEDVASAAGMLAGDLFVFGDVRDVVREGWHGLRGEEVDKLVLGLAGTGIAVTAGIYLSGGLAAPARAGLSVVKAARRGGHIGAPLVRLLKVETREGLVQFASNLGKVQSRAGMRGALEGLKIAEHPQDVAKLATLAAAKGGKTRAIVKLLGRGAIVLTSVAVHARVLDFLGAAQSSGVLRGVQTRGRAHDAAPLRAAAAARRAARETWQRRPRPA